jgi:hypothetical protein
VSSRRNSSDSTLALITTASAAFQPKVANMKGVSHCQGPATISTGGAAKWVRVPPIEMFTKSMPRVAYLRRVDRPWLKKRSRSISAARVIAAGSVMTEPSRGTRPRHRKNTATGRALGSSPARLSTSCMTLTRIGRLAAITMITKTNSGSVKLRPST